MRETNLRADRLLLFIGLIIFIAWGYIYRVTMPEAKDPIVLRIIGSALILLLLTSSFIFSLIQKNLTYCIYALCYILTAHQAFIVLSNNLSPSFVIDYLILIIVFNAYFKSIRQLLIYANYNTLVIAIGYFIISNPLVNFGFLVSNLFTINILTFLIFSSRIRTEKKLAYNEDLMKCIFNNSTDIMILSSPELLFIDCNSYFDDTLKIPKKNIIGRKFTELFEDQFNEDKINEIMYSIRSDNTWKGDIKFASPKGDTMWGDMAIKFIKAGNSKLILIRISDVTERKETEIKLIQKTSELEKTNAELEQMTYVASHDLQEPLRTISGYVQLIQKRYNDQLDTTGREFIKYTVEGAERMRTLINDLLTYSRIGSGNRQMELVDTSRVVNMVLRNLRSVIKENNVKISVKEPLPQIIANEFEISQLFQNLMSNAIKYRGKSEPEIIIEAKLVDENEPKAYFKITDNGIGISEQYKDKIFEVFQRLHARDKFTGTGIGLAICKKIVERHKGKIWIEPAANQGTVFHFTLARKY